MNRNRNINSYTIRYCKSSISVIAISKKDLENTIKSSVKYKKYYEDNTLCILNTTINAYYNDIFNCNENTFISKTAKQRIINIIDSIDTL